MRDPNVLYCEVHPDTPAAWQVEYPPCSSCGGLDCGDTGDLIWYCGACHAESVTQEATLPRDRWDRAPLAQWTPLED
jgi:hypothetical protein